MQDRTKDLVLTFMDREYPDVVKPLEGELGSFLEEAVRKSGTELELEKVLIKERQRRFHGSEESYWGRIRKRLAEKYAGFFVLLRVDSGNELQAELFAIGIKQSDPTTVCVFWMCDGSLRTGDLVANSHRLSGTTVCKSTDSVIEPVTISLLRAGRAKRKGIKLPLVLGGVAAGWKDDDATALFSCRLAVIKLSVEKAIVGEEAFVEVAKRPDVQSTLERIRGSDLVQTGLLPFLKSTVPLMGPLDARNAVTGLTHALATVGK